MESTSSSAMNNMTAGFGGDSQTTGLSVNAAVQFPCQRTVLQILRLLLHPLSITPDLHGYFFHVDGTTYVDPDL